MNSVEPCAPRLAYRFETSYPSRPLNEQGARFTAMRCGASRREVLRARAPGQLGLSCAGGGGSLRGSASVGHSQVRRDALQRAA